VSERQLKTDEALRRAAVHWSEASRRAGVGRTRWWQHEPIVRHINRTICGRPVAGVAGGDIELIRSRSGERRLNAAISIGCGNGTKELSLLETGVVGSFELFEISDVRIHEGLRLAEAKGLSSRVSFRQRSIDFASPHPSCYDLVYWNNALHHMLDVDAALRWSRQVLAPGGLLYVNDFVGPTRMQFPDEMLEIASRARQALPERLLRNPAAEGQLLPREVRRPDPRELAARDPTECADSDDILPAINRHFPEAEVKLTGGVIYHLALNDVLANFRDLEDRWLLELLLLLDDMCIAAGHTHYAVAVGQ
jgi:SAM-dependent methyltransferase